MLDNHAAHHGQEVEQLIRNTGAHLIYLPPYSPEYNPIEGVFSFVKNYVRANDQIYIRAAAQDVKNFIFMAFLNVSSEIVKNFYRNCGY